MHNNEIVVGLDIGTTKICAIVGKVSQHGKVEVLGLGKAESLGVSRGVVANIDKTIEAIKIAVEQAERSSGIKITDVYVGIAGQHIKSLQRRGILARDNQEEVISKDDVDKLKNDMNKMALPAGDIIIHVLPQEYIVDSEPNIKEPIGMFGFRLEANFHIISGHLTAAQNINRCVQRAGLNVKDLILEPLASASSVLSEEEKEAGVVLIDIGGGTTDIAIFQDQIIRHTAVIPLGGNIITEDIKEAFGIMKNQAEKLKTAYGSAYPNSISENEYISIKGLSGRGNKEVSRRSLANVIHARLEEIMEYAYFQIKSSGFEKKLTAGIVLTGGGSLMKGLKPMVESLTGMEARVGYPTTNLTRSRVREIALPSYATGIGLIVRGYQDKINSKAIEEGKPEEAIQVDNPPEIEIQQESVSELNTEANYTDENENNPQKKNIIVRWWEKSKRKIEENFDKGINKITEIIDNDPVDNSDFK
jgi:cell division protein FtsA